MSWLARIGWQRGGLGLAIIAILTVAAVRLCAHAQPSVPEIALVIGEPYEAMRQRSSATIDPALPNEIWYNIPKSDARLRFIDPQYGFVTPPARFFTVGYERGVIGIVHLSPQIEPLLLDEALKTALNLQAQWRKGGWKPIKTASWPLFADTQDWRDKLRACKPNSTYWDASNKYQTQLSIACFQDDKHPNEQRYLVSLDLGKPWVEP